MPEAKKSSRSKAPVKKAPAKKAPAKKAPVKAKSDLAKALDKVEAAPAPKKAHVPTKYEVLESCKFWGTTGNANFKKGDVIERAGYHTSWGSLYEQLKDKLKALD